MSDFKISILQKDTFAKESAEIIVGILNDLLTNSGTASFFLSGGSTPGVVFEQFASEQLKTKIGWNKIKFFFGDERYVPHDDPESNYLMSKKTLFDPLEIPEQQVFPVPYSPERTVFEAATAYEQIIKAELDNRINLQLLGIGADGHTASIFPGSEMLTESNSGQLTAAATHPDSGQKRVSLTPTAILGSEQIVVLAKGEAKAQVIKDIISGNSNYPADILNQVKDKVTWLLDEDAGKLL